MSGWVLVKYSAKRVRLLGLLLARSHAEQKLLFASPPFLVVLYMCVCAPVMCCPREGIEAWVTLFYDSDSLVGTNLLVGAVVATSTVMKTFPAMRVWPANLRSHAMHQFCSSDLRPQFISCPRAGTLVFCHVVRHGMRCSCGQHGHRLAGLFLLYATRIMPEASALRLACIAVV